jgi:3',5'-cyclic AMP phosphodiesterase CpdA
MKFTRLAIFVLFLLVNRYSIAQTQVDVIADDHYEIILQDIKKDSIAILQVTDVHLGNAGKWAADFKAVRRIKSFVKNYQPDLIIVTGDLFTGEKESKENIIAFAVQFFDDLERPWIYVFGNHDPEGGVSRKNIRQIFKDSIWGIIGFHTTANNSEKYDFQVDLKSGKTQNPLWEIYAFDSGSEKGNKSIKTEQIQWFRQKSLASKKTYQKIIPAISIFHIPLLQYQLLWEDPALSTTGFCNETVCFEEDDGSVYKAFLRQGNIKACFCGHDHDNNYWGKYHGGILLVYGHVSGEACYHRHWEPGAKLIKLPVNGREIGIRELMLPNDG